MNGWVDGWVDVWMDEWIGSAQIGWIGRPTSIHSCMHACMNGYGWMDNCVDE